MTQSSETLAQYFDSVQKETNRALELANAARKEGFDPEDKVDIPLAKNMAERVLGLVSAVAPQLVESRIVDRIVELEKQYDPLDWRVGFKIAEEVAKQEFCTFSSKKEAAEVGIRTGFMYLTGGIVSAPLEGYVEAKVKKTQDGKEYLASIYAGPIRGAGGTAAATSVILSDYVATKLGYAKYDPTEEEINRAVTELRDYHERVTNLQYFPSEDEIRFMVKHLPIEVDGEPTERIEVSNYKDVNRIETNFIRGGICLVIGEGLCQKAPKLWKRLSKWGKEFGIDWSFLEEFLTLQKTIKAKGKKKKSGSKISKNFTYIADIVAGRPVLTYPMEFGGFRLRYGRTRASGFSCSAVHPATLVATDNYIVYGTQLKTERPGKACSISICEHVDGPVVKLHNGDVVRVTMENTDVLKKTDQILFLGDILTNYGDFSENGHPLVPVGYCEEWWLREVEKALAEQFSLVCNPELYNKPTEFIASLDASQVEVVCTKLALTTERFFSFFLESFTSQPSFEEAVSFSTHLGVPLYPQFTFFYEALTHEELSLVYSLLSTSTLGTDPNDSSKHILVAEVTSIEKGLLEKIGLPHRVIDEQSVQISGLDAQALAFTFGAAPYTKEKPFSDSFSDDGDVVDILSEFCGVTLRKKGGTFIGARMGRPEKAKMRKLQGSPQVLFPVGEEGGRLRSFQSSADVGTITSMFPLYYDEESQKRSVYPISHITGKKTKQLFYNPKLNKESLHEVDPDTGEENLSYKNMTINVGEYIESALKILNTKVYPDLIKGVKGTSNKKHIPEHLVKGFLRAKHDIYVNKDGTTRYDMSESPLTAFRPVEIGTPLDKLKELGYKTDIYGKELTDENQTVELFPQDVILPAGVKTMEEQADEVLFRTGNFVDELLQTLYKKKPYYKFKSVSDVIGSLIICLAPHISCGTIGRVVGFSRNQVMAAHPMMHAALRRDCDGDEACFILLMDGFLNFSRQFLPDRRGSRTMDAPLVLSSHIIPSEVDDQVHGLDVVSHYPLELYEAAEEFKNPWEVPVTQLNNNLGTIQQYEGFHSTHPVNDLNFGEKVSAYKILPSMQEKLDGQMGLARKIAAVDAPSVATMVIQKHFIRDIKGNLRKFSMQQFRCITCNEKYKRPPLVGRCLSPKCNGRIVFTISEGSVVKYLEPSLKLARDYEVSPYLKQTLDLTKERVESLFGKEKEVQEGLSKFF